MDPAPLDVAVGFAVVLRALGVPVPPDCVVAYARALDAVGLDERDGTYWAGRATLVRRPEDVPAYDAAFHRYWEGGRPTDPDEVLMRTGRRCFLVIEQGRIVGLVTPNVIAYYNAQATLTAPH